MLNTFHPSKTDGGKGIEIPLNDDGRAIRRAEYQFGSGVLVGLLVQAGYAPTKAEAMVERVVRYGLELSTDKQWWPNDTSEDIAF